MKSSENYIQTTVKVPYYTLNNLQEETEYIWLVFHGYGQLAQYFIQKFQELPAAKHFIIAPQGLSKFYLEGVSGRVGASWMTREKREVDITNQYQYLDDLLSNFHFSPHQKLIYFGFSQGVATMFRYMAYSKRPFHKLISWAGTCPEDIPEKEFEFMTGNEIFYSYVSETDPFIKPEIIEAQKKLIAEKLKIDPDVRWYEGGHKVIQEEVSRIF